MKHRIAIVFISLMIASFANAQDMKYLDDWVDLGFARYRTTTDGGVLAIDTLVSVTNAKSLIARNEGEVKKNCPDFVGTLYGKMMKIDDVQAVVFSYRRIEIVKFPYGTTWQDIVPKVEELLFELLKPQTGGAE